MIFETFTPFTTPITPTLSIHGIKSPPNPNNPNLPALLLLHGFPQTHHIWHKIANRLNTHFNVIALDLRGYGNSKFSTPISTSTSTDTTTQPHKTFSKSTMATDCLTVMNSLGYTQFYICAHDRGARVAHSLLTTYPKHIKKALLLDIIPTLSTYNQVSKEFSEAYWHWFFLSQPTPFPENAILSNPGLFAEKFFKGSIYGGCSGDGSDGKGNGVGIFGEEVMRIYVEQLGDWETVYCMCEDYRAAATVDLEEAKEDLERGRRIKCPVRVLWGNRGIYVKMFDVLKEWRVVSDGEVSGEQIDSGHYIPEEVPDVLVKHIKEFFV